MKYCSSCGTQVQEGVPYCPNCGSPMNQPQSVEEPLTTEVKVEEKPLTEETKVEEKTPKKNPFKGIVNFFRKKIILILLILVIVLVAIILLLTSRKDNQIEIKVKSSLEKIVEKSDLETINIVYNVIAKKCKDEATCDKTSNNIDNFEYVVSCKGTVTAGIDFSKVKITVLESEKKIIIEMPEAAMQGEPNIGSIKFLNGDEVPASKLPEARKLCQEVALDKSETDDKLIPFAKDQAKVVLEEFYKQWIKAYDSSYVIEVK